MPDFYPGCPGLTPAQGNLPKFDPLECAFHKHDSESAFHKKSSHLANQKNIQIPSTIIQYLILLPCNHEIFSRKQVVLMSLG